MKASPLELRDSGRRLESRNCTQNLANQHCCRHILNKQKNLARLAGTGAGNVHPQRAPDLVDVLLSVLNRSSHAPA
jgi:hypothetical protein